MNEILRSLELKSREVTPAKPSAVRESEFVTSRSITKITQANQAAKLMLLSLLSRYD